MAVTKRALHDEQCFYGDTVEGHVLGSPRK